MIWLCGLVSDSAGANSAIDSRTISILWTLPVLSTGLFPHCLTGLISPLLPFSVVPATFVAIISGDFQGVEPGKFEGEGRWTTRGRS